MNFDSYIGQNKIKRTLHGMLKEKKLTHAYLFEGPAGMGKFTLAKIFAKTILCQKSKEEPCGICSSCIKFASANHPDFYTISPKGLSIGVDEIRKLQDDIIIKPIESAKKIYIIEKADKMTEQAQNCLLKTLEEPVGDSLLILCVENAGSMLRTIQSRCVSIKFDNYSIQEIKDILCRNGISDQNTLELAGIFSQGVLGKAFAFASKDFIQVREDVIRFFSSLNKIENLLKIALYFEQKKEIIEDLLDILAAWYRDLAVYKASENDRLLINCDKKDIIIKNIEEYTEQDIVNIVNIIESARKDIRRNINLTMVLDNMLIDFWEVVNGKGCRSAV